MKHWLHCWKAEQTRMSANNFLCFFAAQRFQESSQAANRKSMKILEYPMYRIMIINLQKIMLSSRQKPTLEWPECFMKAIFHPFCGVQV